MPLVGRIAAGGPILTEQAIEDVFPLPSEGTLFLLKVAGDSMMNAAITDGDWVVVRNHRVALPDDETLMDELVSVRLRKNTLGVYRLDHDTGQHDDQAVALALGTHYLLDADGGAESWIRWARHKAEITQGLIPPDPPRAPIAAPAPPPEPERESVLTGLVLDATTARKRARDEAYQASPDGIMMRIMNGG